MCKIFVSPDIQGILSYEEIYEEEEDQTPGLACTNTGSKISLAVPEGELWVPEMIQITLTTGSTARFDVFDVHRSKADNSRKMVNVITPAVELRALRGIHYSDMFRMFPGDYILARCTTGHAGDIARIIIWHKTLFIGSR